MNFKRKILVTSILLQMMVTTESFAATNGYGEATPTEATTGSDYTYVESAMPYLYRDTTNSWHISSPEIQALVDQNTNFPSPIFFGEIGQTASNMVFDNETDAVDSTRIRTFIGNDVGGGGIELNNDGPTSITVLYENYAKDVLINNANGGNFWIDSNDASGATINNSGQSSIYIYENSVVGANLNNLDTKSKMIINGNNADGVTIINNGEIIGGHNIATNANVTNNATGKMSFYGTDVSGSTVNNSGKFVIGNCSVDDGCRSSATMQGTMAKGLIINNLSGGETSISGELDFDSSVINNSGTLNLDNLTIVTPGSPTNKGQVISDGIVNLTGNNTLNFTDINNSKLINMSNGVLNENFIVGGDYTGTGGSINIDTKLNGDNSDTDFIQIQGDVTGKTEIKINNVGGAGAQTVSGIHVIQTGTSTSDAFFIGNGGYVTAGAYDYGLFLENNTDWFLKSHLNNTTPVYTADMGSYISAETMGNTLFTTRLEDREGASQFQNVGNKEVGNIWARTSGGHTKFKSLNNQLKSSGNSFVTQIGAGFVTLGDEDQYNLGAMGGFAYYDGKTRSNLTDRQSKIKVDGYSLGLYGTWYAHPVEKRGAYIDSWVLWNKFTNKVDTPDQNRYKYDSSGVTASIELGGDYLLGKYDQKSWWIQPQTQLIYQGVHADKFKDAQGIDIQHGKDNIQARMGVKTYLDIPTNGNALTSYRPYIALNYIHNTNPYSVKIDGNRFENEGSSNLGEFKIGVEGNVTKNNQVWLNASFTSGSQSNQTYQGNIGWKYNF